MSIVAFWAVMPCSLVGGNFNPEDGVDTFLRNDGNHLQDPRRHNLDEHNEQLHFLR
jgi:hypothetical protein